MKWAKMGNRGTEEVWGVIVWASLMVEGCFRVAQNKTGCPIVWRL